MNGPRRSFAPALLVFLGVGLILLFWIRSNPAVPPPALAAEARPASLIRATAASSRATTDTVADLQRVAARPAPTTPERGAEMLVLAGESFARDHGQGLNLTEAEVKALGRSFVYHQQVRVAFEAELATITPTDAVVTITIPPYPAAGQHLRELWLADLTSTLGAERAAVLAERMSVLIELRFCGFGQDHQQIVITPAGREGRDNALSYDVRWYRTSIYPQGDPRFTSHMGSGHMPLQFMEGGELTHYLNYIRQLKPGKE